MVIANASGCGAHMQSYDELLPGTGLPVRDVLAFLHDEGLGDIALRSLPVTVAYHDACHALRAQHIHGAPRALLAQIPDLRVVEIADGDRCCGAAGIYAVTQPETAGRARRPEGGGGGGDRCVDRRLGEPGLLDPARRAPSCAGGQNIEVVHPVELLDRAMDQARSRSARATSDAK